VVNENSYGMISEERAPTEDEIKAWLQSNSNWGRWGADDQLGALNLITPEKRIAAAQLIKLGRTISLARDLDTAPGPRNPQPVQHFVRWFNRESGRGGGAGDYVAFHVHGYQNTHIDALCHGWGERGMWNGRDYRRELTPRGALWGGLEHWRDGIVTRGVLLDVARHRGVDHVPFDQPVHAAELKEIARRQKVTLAAGDAIIVHSGRDALEAAQPDWNPNSDPHPGLSVTTLKFLRECDAAVLVWDLMDAQPFEIGWPFVPHAALHELGIPLVDNCSLGELSALCSELNRYEFMFVAAPLPLVGGTGSPLNPLAVL
jgi:kynurenine formamidase